MNRAEMLTAAPAALILELDGPTPRPLDAALDGPATEALAGAMAEDLQRALGPEVAEAGLIVAGGVYDLTELLRPGMPVIDLLLELYRGAQAGAGFSPVLIGLSTAEDDFPIEALRPRGAAGAGPLLAVPFALVGPGRVMDRLARTMESRLLEKGIVGREALQRVSRGFAIQPRSVGYATFADLSAVLRSQLLHGGFDGLWEILSAAWRQPEGPALITTPTGNRFLLRESRVHTPFVTVDQWSKAPPAGDPSTGAYLEWLKCQRQYQAGLEAHGIEVIHVAFEPDRPVDAAAPGSPLPSQLRLVEPVAGDPDGPGDGGIRLTEHAPPETGAVAYSVLVHGPGGSVAYAGNEYPLRPEAVMQIRRDWEARAGGRLDLRRPGTLLRDREGALVSADAARPAGSH